MHKVLMFSIIPLMTMSLASTDMMPSSPSIPQGQLCTSTRGFQLHGKRRIDHLHNRRHMGSIKRIIKSREAKPWAEWVANDKVIDLRHESAADCCSQNKWREFEDSAQQSNRKRAEEFHPHIMSVSFANALSHQLRSRLPIEMISTNGKRKGKPQASLVMIDIRESPLKS